MQEVIPDHLMKRLIRLAKQRDRTASELLAAMLDSQEGMAPPRGALAALAENARLADLSSPETVNTSEESRQILESEFPNKPKSDEDARHHG